MFYDIVFQFFFNLKVATRVGGWVGGGRAGKRSG